MSYQNVEVTKRSCDGIVDFNVVRGTIFATSRLSKGIEEATFAEGAAPIALIDGNKLIELLIKHGIGVRMMRHSNRTREE
ncbi:MAG: hypothetical protein CSB44_12145 [Gammaproteobacteria bacterium]|nr:MAG: hypothetical protein CSB44_12145 [Gammaproteobacteria bacterium]